LGGADVNADGRVEYSELKAFIAAANGRVEDGRGKVDLYAVAPARDRSAALSDLTRPSPMGHLLVPPNVQGHHWLEDARAVRVADFHKEPGRQLLLALPRPGVYFLRSTAHEARFSVRAGELEDGGALDFRPVALAARGAVDEAFREHLFRVPFGPRFYEGFVASTGEAAVLPPGHPDVSLAP
jgi:hypothetical protein